MSTFIKILLLTAGISLVASLSLNSASVPVEKFLIESPKIKDANETVIASGNLGFENQVEIRPEITGVVSQVLVKAGSIVRKGDELIRLEQTDFIMNIKSATADLNIREIELRRLEEVRRDIKRQLTDYNALRKKKFVSEEELLELQSKLTLADLDVKKVERELNKFTAELERAKEHLKKTVFRSPIDGVVLKVDVEPGESVIAGTTNILGSSMLQIADQKSLVAKLRVDEADIGNVYLGQKTMVYLAAQTDVSTPGVVKTIGLIAENRQVGSGLIYRVEVEFTDSIKFYSGMSCRAELILRQEENVLTVPISAITYEDNKPFVWSVDAGIVKKRFLEVGISTDIEQSVLSGIDISDRIIVGPVRAMSNLKEGKVIHDDNA